MRAKLTVCQGPSLGQTASGLATMEAVVSVVNSQQVLLWHPALRSLEPVIKRVTVGLHLVPSPPGTGWISALAELNRCGCPGKLPPAVALPLSLHYSFSSSAPLLPLQGFSFPSHTQTVFL